MAIARRIAFAAAVLIVLIVAGVGTYDRFTHMTLNDIGIFMLRPWFYIIGTFLILTLLGFASGRR